MYPSVHERKGNGSDMATERATANEKIPTAGLGLVIMINHALMEYSTPHYK
jgi:hypothetical protein